AGRIEARGPTCFSPQISFAVPRHGGHDVRALGTIMGMSDTEPTTNRRSFLKGAAAATLAAGLPAAGAEPPAKSDSPNRSKSIGIQIGGVSFTDEGVEPVLDILQERGGVNALFLATFTYGRGIAGRQVPGQPLPDHGKQEYDTGTFHGGNYATPHPQFYHDTPLKPADTKAPDLGNVDILELVLPAARKRQMK